MAQGLTTGNRPTKPHGQGGGEGMSTNWCDHLKGDPIGWLLTNGSTPVRYRVYQDLLEREWMLNEQLFDDHSEKGRVMDTIEVRRTTRCKAFWATVGAIIIVHVLVWFLFYPLAGYNDITVTVATGTFLFLGLVLVALFSLGWRRIGLGPERLWEALLVLGAAYLVILVLVLALRSLGWDLPVPRNQYSLYAIASNWTLTGLGEELLFAGVLFQEEIHVEPRTIRCFY